MAKNKKGFRNLARAAVLSAAFASALAGCATPWRKTRSDWQPTRRYETTFDSASYDKELTREFGISEPYFNEVYKTRVDELSTQKNFETDYYSNREYVKEIATEQREIDYITPLTTIGGAILGSVILGGMGSGIDAKEKTTGIGTFGGLVGFLGVGAIGFAVGMSLPKSIETKTSEGRLDYRTYPGKSARKYIGQGILYQGKSAGINTELSAEGRIIKTLTDDNGELDISKFIEALDSGYFFRSAYLPSDKNYSRSELEKRIREIPIIRNIKPQTLEVLMSDFVNGISAKKITVNVKTNEEVLKPYKNIINASKSFIFSGEELSADAIYRVIKNFIDREINSHIKSLTFDVKDITTHMPIRGSNFNTSVEAPSKEELLERYFTGKLAGTAKNFVLDYLRGTSLLEGAGNPVVFYVYAPAKVSLEVTNPDYKYVNGEVLVNEDVKKTVEMVDKGDKLRVEGETNATGKIE